MIILNFVEILVKYWKLTFLYSVFCVRVLWDSLNRFRSFLEIFRKFLKFHLQTLNSMFNRFLSDLNILDQRSSLF